MAANLPESIDSYGFVHAHCTACNDPNVWLTCNQCDKSDHFVVMEGVIHCKCGATYDHATCTCGERVEAAQLEWTPFTKGPMTLADLEWDYRRVALLFVALFVAAVAVWWFVWG